LLRLSAIEHQRDAEPRSVILERGEGTGIVERQMDRLTKRDVDLVGGAPGTLRRGRRFWTTDPERAGNGWIASSLDRPAGPSSPRW
jgi:hypothetical protein